MNKKELFALANKGKVEINGIPLEVIIRPGPVDGSPWIDIIVEPLSPLHLPLRLGKKWWEYVTDEECEELPQQLLKYKAEAEEFCQKAKRVVKAKINPDGTYSFTEVPDSVKENFRDYPSALKRWLTQKHHITFVNDEKREWFAPGVFTLELEGIRYIPHWSYWLERPYYVVSD